MPGQQHRDPLTQAGELQDNDESVTREFTRDP
jgi:hypothetical protein